MTDRGQITDVGAGPVPVQTVATSLKPRSEDAWGALRHDGVPVAVWVIDGATPLGATDRVLANAQVAHFAWALSDALSTELASMLDDSQDRTSGSPLPGADRVADSSPTAAPLRDNVLGSVEAARARASEAFAHRHADATVPTATLALVLRHGHDLVAVSLGDSVLWVETARGIESVVDPQYVGNEDRALERWRALVANGTTPECAYTQVLEGQAADRPLRNTERGLWILGDSAAAAQHATVVTFGDAGPTRVVVASDGMERVVEPFELATREHLFGALHQGRGLDLTQALRTQESVDRRRTRHPRLTTHDDVTAVGATL